MLDDDLNEKLIGMKKVNGGSMEETQLVEGVAFKKTFSYAGFEQQPKRFENPKIICLNIELELKSERDNAEVRYTSITGKIENKPTKFQSFGSVEKVEDYQAIVDAEWKIIYEKLEKIVATGAKVVLSKVTNLNK